MDFCLTDAEGSLRWQAVTGVGGTGKSRLAWQLCQEMRERGWEAIFLDKSFFETGNSALTDWELPVDVLFVIDYVVFHEKAIADWMASLSKHIGHKIRILLLEREGWHSSDRSPVRNRPLWYTQLAEAWTEEDLEQCRGHAEGANPVIALDVRPLSPHEQVAIVTSAKDENGHAIPKDIAQKMVDRLQSIDPGFERPLYLLFLASAYLEDPSDSDWNHWDAKKMHSVIYSREMQRLAAVFGQGYDKLAADLWAFSTATHTDISNVFDDPAPHLAQRISAVSPLGQDTFRTECRANCSFAAADITPYLPDIPGEFFVMSRLCDVPETDFTASCAAFARDAWSTSPIGFTQFLFRLINDFASTASEYGLLELNTLLTEPSDPNNVFSYAMVLVNLSAEPDVSTHEVHTICDILAEFARRFPDNPNITLRYAMALANLTIDSTDTDEIRDTTHTIAHLTAHFPDNPDIAKPYARELTIWLILLLEDSINAASFTQYFIEAQENPVIRTVLLSELGRIFVDDSDLLATAYENLRGNIDPNHWVMQTIKAALGNISGGE